MHSLAAAPIQPAVLHNYLILSLQVRFTILTILNLYLCCILSSSSLEFARLTAGGRMLIPASDAHAIRRVPVASAGAGSTRRQWAPAPAPDRMLRECALEHLLWYRLSLAICTNALLNISRVCEFDFDVRIIVRRREGIDTILSTNLLRHLCASLMCFFESSPKSLRGRSEWKLELLTELLLLDKTLTFSDRKSFFLLCASQTFVLKCSREKRANAEAERERSLPPIEVGRPL